MTTNKDIKCSECTDKASMPCDCDVFKAGTTGFVDGRPEGELFERLNMSVYGKPVDYVPASKTEQLEAQLSAIQNAVEERDKDINERHEYDDIADAKFALSVKTILDAANGTQPENKE